MVKTLGKNFSGNNSSKNIDVVGVGKVGKRDSKAKKSDFYETPYSLTRKFLDVEEFDKDKTVCEPACGGGAITRVLNEYWKDDKITAYDREKNFFWDYDDYNYIVTNPPFSIASEFIKWAKRRAKDKFAFLLPLSYLHGKKRYDEIYSDKTYGLSKVYVFTRYPMLGDELREDGKYNTGMMVYAWFVWESGHSGLPMIDWIDNNQDVLSKKDDKVLSDLTPNPLSSIIDT